MRFITCIAFSDSPKISNRKKNVRKKLNAMALEFADKIVLLVDGKSFMFYSQDINFS